MNRLSFALVATALLTIVAAPLASATDTDTPPLVGWCVDGVRGGCWGPDTACVGFSYQIPFCVELPIVICLDCTSDPAMCMYYYYEIDTGVVRYVQRDSCHSEIYVLGERVK